MVLLKVNSVHNAKNRIIRIAEVVVGAIINLMTAVFKLYKNMVGKGLKTFLIIVCVIVVFAFLGPLILKILNVSKGDDKLLLSREPTFFA